MSRDTVSRCLETSLHFWGCPTSRLVMVAPSSLVSRPGPAAGLRPALTPAAGGTFGPGSGCRAGCGCGLFGWAGWQPAGLVVPAGVQDQFAHQLTGVAVDDADVQVVDEQADRGAGEPGAEADVVQPAVVAHGHTAAAVDLVVSDPAVGGDDRAAWNGFGPGLIGLGGGCAGPTRDAAGRCCSRSGTGSAGVAARPEWRPGAEPAAISSGSDGTVLPCRRSADGTAGSGADGSRAVRARPPARPGPRRAAGR